MYIIQERIVVIKDTWEGIILIYVKIRYVEANFVDKYDISDMPKVVKSFIESCLILCLFLVPSLFLYLCLLSLKNNMINVKL